MRANEFDPRTWTVFSDFDGTITLQDSNAEMVRRWGSEEARRDEAAFWSGKAVNRIVMPRHYATIRMREADYYEFLHAVPIDPGFADFYHRLRAAGGSLTVLTGSGERAVRSYLRHAGFGEIAVRGNRLETEEGVVLFYPVDAVEDTLCGEGPCAHCKSAHLERERRAGRRVLYIGDGMTDLCPARHADLLFACSALADHCDANGIPHTRFAGFAEIAAALFGAARSA